eukprot:CAMPEP_0205921876 /NCGR_PEP_ID=MMETSP1325-20131115/13556_1 /ASSEMBLY_ACC=CAM_ASM_000708 /TAXON_ID=236786 /ORGANISM="Florenciella sp., Strain RCC1007" /LENGTH=127 /DNA_ID=CAMNT_0053289793 /DNA_START=103 /DNA_END=482 /DNA_ORIENTATION=-
MSQNNKMHLFLLLGLNLLHDLLLLDEESAKDPVTHGLATQATPVRTLHRLLPFVHILVLLRLQLLDPVESRASLTAPGALCPLLELVEHQRATRGLDLQGLVRLGGIAVPPREDSTHVLAHLENWRR